MARINVDDFAFDDPRFDILAGSLGCLRDRWHALGRCLRIWHLCASRRCDTSDTEHVFNQVYDALGVDSPSAALHKLAAIVAAGPVSHPRPASLPVERCGCDESLQLRAELRAIRGVAFDALAHVLASGGLPR